ncbi:trypsin-like peptidase domain-containing protein [Streptomyces sp. NPDC008001]|uniref:trypsin-like peptidase domain-containing protein n=1 Tax=Streptomyces sp. NPDC008001 TaxID=3364804 RepID=UPI0036E25326
MRKASPARRTGQDSWVVSIHATERDMRPVGSGFLIDSQRILTCAHVVRTARSKQEELWAAFPKAEEVMGRRIRIAEVTLPSDSEREDRDVAVLRLADEVPAVPVAPLQRPSSDELVGMDWSSFGFPDGVLGNSANGSVGASLGYGWVRLDTHAPRYPVKSGYSGAPVWSHTHQAVVGMVGQAHNTTGDARALSLWAIDRLLPGEELHRLTDSFREIAGQTVSARWGWSLGKDLEADRHWKPRARGVSTEAERGFRFRGRTAALQEIIQWIEAEKPPRQVLVITGAPGSGKSTVLGRVVTTADDQVAATLPPHDTAVRAPLGAVSCAVHAKGKTALEVAKEIARAVPAPAPGQLVDLLPALRVSLQARPGRPFTLVVDALDEASTPHEARDIINHILVPLSETCADLPVHVVAGTRRRDAAGDLLVAFGRRARTVDLDTPEFSAPTDLTAYALATLQLQGDERPGNPYSDSAAGFPVAERIAALAEGNFLVAGLVARAHGMHDEQAVNSADVTFPVTVEASLRAYLRLLPDTAGLSSEHLLTPLAYAESPGLTLALWRIALVALFGAAPTEAELFSFARSSAANFLVETAGKEPCDAVFRLFHQALSDSLRAARADVASPVSDERALACAYIAEGARTGWEAAPAYLLRSLAGHAARGGVIDRLLEEGDYLLYADLRRLIPQTRLAVTDAGRERARLLRQTPRALDSHASERAALFSVTEVQEHLGTTYRTSAVAAPYRATWSSASPSMEVSVFEGHTRQVSALCFLKSAGRGVLASAGDDAIRLWDPETGDSIRALTGNPGWIGALCTVDTTSGALLASGGEDGVLRLWDPEAGEITRLLVGHGKPIDQLCTVEVGGRTLLASRGRDRCLKLWDPETGENVRTFRARTHMICGMGAVYLEGCSLLALWTADSQGRSRVRLWDPSDGTTVRTFATRGVKFGEMSVVPCEGRPLIAFSETSLDDDVIVLRDALTGRQVRILEGGQGSVYDVLGLRIGGRTLVVAGHGQEESGTVMVWDPLTGREVHRLEGHRGWVGALCTVEAAGETLIASAGEDCTVRLWDVDSHTELEEPDVPGCWVGSLAVLHIEDRAVVASSGVAGRALLRDLVTGEPLGHVDTRHTWVKLLCTIEIEDRPCLVIASTASEAGAIEIWNPDTGDMVRSLETPGVQSMQAVEVAGRRCLAFAARDQKVNRVSLWDVSADRILGSISGEEGLVHGLCGVRTERHDLIVILTDHFGIWPGEFHGGAVSCWDPVSGEVLESVEIPEASLASLCVLDAEDRELLAVTTHDRDDEGDLVGTSSVRVVDPVTGHIIDGRDVHHGWVSALSSVEFGEHACLASAGQTQRSVRLWTVDGLRQVIEIPVRREVFSVVQAGAHLVVGLENGVMAIRLGDCAA